MNKPPAPSDTSRTGQRLAKRMAGAGVCSRREAEVLIIAGRVRVNGRVVATPAFNVGDSDLVLVDNKPIAPPPPTRVWRYHKPRGLLCTTRDERGRPTIFDRLPDGLPRLVTVGRLDLDSEGLLLLTTDGDLKRHLELPATGWIRQYRVRCYGAPDAKGLTALANGITIDGERFGSIRVTVDRAERANVWLSLSLAEGRNREVRRALEHVGCRVNRLIRTAFGPFQLGTLNKGVAAEVTPGQLRSQLGTHYRGRARSDPGRAHRRR